MRPLEAHPSAGAGASSIGDGRRRGNLVLNIATRPWRRRVNLVPRTLTTPTAPNKLLPSGLKLHQKNGGMEARRCHNRETHTALTAPTKSLPSGLKLHQKNNGATRRSCWWPWLAKQTIASSNMLPWHSCHWVRTAAYQTTAPFIKNVARASRWLYCEDALHRRFEAGHSAPTEIHGRLPPSPYRPRRHMGGGRSPVL